MRKLSFFSVILALCVVNIGADAATRGSVNPSNVQSSAGVGAKSTASNTAARAAAVRSAQRTPATTTQVKQTTSGRVTGTTTQTKKNSSVQVGRAGTQKVINGGTKVNSAAANTVVAQECQDAFYGCMDAFCMLDNVSGGRCQCSDRNAELDTVLEEILKLDEQSYALATEGVERIQMGDNADLIMARAKSTADKVAKQTLADKEKETKKRRTLDLSLWNTNLFSDTDDGADDIFSDMDSSADTSFANKKGDDLQAAAAKLCVKQLPEQCATSASVLRSIYGQKIQSDCAAYQNSLRQQKTTSQQKLMAAQKALRDTALEMYENENKYDLGECSVQFKQCLQTTAECGTDFSGCIADTAILQALYNKSGGKGASVATTSVKTGATSITISSATYDILANKKKICEGVTKQCVNANKNDAVWKTVLKDIVPAVYTAEFTAASNNRMNCISTIVSCVQNYCGSKWDETDDNYDACLSDPDSVIKNACKLEAAKCGDVATSNNVMNYVRAKLAALRVDKCTLEIKQCLTSEDNCGEDYSACIGLDTDTIVDLCDNDKLIACQTKYNTSTVRDYIARVAQGLALNIDNQFAVTCRNAANAAMQRICGITNDDTEEEVDGYCPGLILSNAEIKNSFKWQYCVRGQSTCYDELVLVPDNLVKDNKIVPRLTGRLRIGDIRFNEKGTGTAATTGADIGKYFYSVTPGTTYTAADGYTDTNNVILSSVIDAMNRDYLSVVAQAKSDPTVDACLNGKSFQTIKSNSARDTVSSVSAAIFNATNAATNRAATKQVKKARTAANNTAMTTTTPTGQAVTVVEKISRYPDLLSGLYKSVGNQILSSILLDYNKELASALNSDKKGEMYEAITDRIAKIIANEIAKGAGTKDICNMTAEEYTAFMANPDYINMMEQKMDEQNRADCMAYCDSETKNCEPNFCTRMNSACEDGRENAGLQTYKKTPAYDVDTNVCTITVLTYNCEDEGGWWIFGRRNRNKCARWNTSDTDATVSYETQTMSKFYAPSQFEFCQGFNDDSAGGSASGAGVNNGGSGNGGSLSGGSSGGHTGNGSGGR